ncbi:MAG: hypothetical protein ABIP97_09100 [Chthoniobacterales bacterium]
MKTLRFIHLYLGCLFAPLIVFFAISGLWQTKILHIGKTSAIGPLLTRLSSIHTGRTPKIGGGLSSIYMECFVILMALCLIFTIIAGVILAFKYGRTRIAAVCLAAGITVPVALALIALYGVK